MRLLLYIVTLIIIKGEFTMPSTSSSLSGIPEVLSSTVFQFAIDPSEYVATKAIFSVSRGFRGREDSFIEHKSRRDLVVGSLFRKADGVLENMSPRFQQFIKKVRKSVEHLSLNGIPLCRYELHTKITTHSEILRVKWNGETHRLDKETSSLAVERVSQNPSLTIAQHNRLREVNKTIQKYDFSPFFLWEKTLRKTVQTINLLPELLRLFPSIKTIDTSRFLINTNDCKVLSACRHLSTVKLQRTSFLFQIEERTQQLATLLDAPSLTDLDTSSPDCFHELPTPLFSKMGNLRALSIRMGESNQNQMIRDIGTLHRLERLKTEGFNEFSNQDLMPLRALTGLRELSLRAEVSVQEGEPLFFSTLIQLEKLCLQRIFYQVPFGTRPTFDLSALLKQHTNLHTIAIYNSDAFNLECTLSTLPETSSLKKLFLFSYHCSSETLHQLSQLRSLSSLGIRVFSYTENSDPFAGFASIQSLQTLLITDSCFDTKKGLEKLLNALKLLPYLRTFGLYLPRQTAIVKEVEDSLRKALPECTVHVIAEGEAFREQPKFFLDQI